ncbi:Fur family transcriptional regulator [Gimesia aquarii]|uniref:Ferric uptake regulation protein n=1 Tax=Gimesia aquarii TaxID=2527964 RepID=A0A517WW34_9PLAN|nr:Fur family transcriptional regulator [Gimesia aquarii]QDT98280.1 Ferric uptake regulation protein [Gimesia aquarii]QDU09485.1 Ferric uptake regulation protein [Gimesia aquarii]
MLNLESLEIAVSPTEKFREYLATKGMRLTQERELIVTEVFSSHEHFDADQLVERMAAQKTGRRVSRSTVYRTLGWLEESGLLRKVARTNDRDVYEHDYGYPQHDHFICKSCGELFEFQNSDIAEILEKLAEKINFRMNEHRLEVYGICEDCSRPTQRRHKKLDLI